MRRRTPRGWLVTTTDKAGALSRALRTPGARWWVSAAVGAAAGIAVIATARVRTAPLRVPVTPPVSDLSGVSPDIDGSESIWVRYLGEGLYELVGHADDPEAARLVARALAERPGVVAVVNRVFTTSGPTV